MRFANDKDRARHRSAHSRWRNDGLTLVEVLVVLFIIIVLIAVLLPPLGTNRDGGGRQFKDASQIRGIHQALVVWAHNNQDHYPLPSLIDTDNATVPEEGSAKDTTANILSILIFNSFMSPYICINPAETNKAIVEYEDYEFDEPSAAVDPANALWDPAFSADFESGIANSSYAHQLPIGPTGDVRWNSTFNATEPILGNRGPEISNLTYDKNGSPKPTYAIPDSLTFLIHGSKKTWEGNIAYNDNHVSFETSLAPEGITYIIAPTQTRPDVLFYDEPDAAAGVNAYLGIFTKAGPEPKDFKAIWD